MGKGPPAATLSAPQSLSGSTALGRLAHDVATETKGLAGHVLSLDCGPKPEAARGADPRGARSTRVGPARAPRRCPPRGHRESDPSV